MSNTIQPNYGTKAYSIAAKARESKETGAQAKTQANSFLNMTAQASQSKAKEAMENWKPTGDNPFYGSIDGRFIAPKEIHELSNVPPGSKAVVIHPKVQERMEQDPAYAQEIFAKIDTWFNFDVARNEAILPAAHGTCPRVLLSVKTGISATHVPPPPMVKLPIPAAALSMEKAGGIGVRLATLK